MEKNGWDRIYRENRLEKIPWHTEHPEKNLVKLVEQGKIRPGEVLDMCSGVGTNSIYLASKGFKVTGVDISPAAVNMAKERCLRKGLACNYLVGKVLKFKTNKKFDFIFDRGCFHHIPDKDKPKYVKRLINLLKGNGRVYIQCFSDKNHFDKSISKEAILRYFSGPFKIAYIKESIHTEPGGGKIYMHNVFMEKK
ncbi:class I SAM-dependent methyltransferase [Candidatus Woesearchaeota archaeon]|nr:class I SAM-dependent methyltransferase [Candidatus Woesearchaeota archaeon]